MSAVWIDEVAESKLVLLFLRDVSCGRAPYGNMSARTMMGTDVPPSFGCVFDREIVRPHAFVFAT
jgi:hypothetical protein